MSLNTLYEDLLFLGGYVTDPHVFEKGPLPNGDRVTYLLVGDATEPSTKSQDAKAA
ncbi:MAG TPA: hypothetical protein VFL14_11940 [Xanthomonadales bacterium]|nr:hypothetical protein [Xanthomonadales bacterium]